MGDGFISKMKAAERNLDTSGIAKIYPDYIQPISISNLNQDISRDRSKEVSEILSHITKKTNPAYVEAVHLSRNDPLAYRMKKLFRRMRPKMSADRFLDISQELSRLEPSELIGAVQALEKKYGYK